LSFTKNTRSSVYPQATIDAETRLEYHQNGDEL
jgi:hypothetical protein